MLYLLLNPFIYFLLPLSSQRFLYLLFPSFLKNFEEKRLADFRRTNPKAAFASEITGAIATSVAVSPVLALLKSPKFITDLSKGTKAFLQSGGAGAIYGANTGEEGDRGMNALKVGGLSAFGGFILNKIGGVVSNKYNTTKRTK